MSKSNFKADGWANIRYALGEVESRIKAAGRESETLEILRKAADPMLDDMRRQATFDPKMRSHDLHDAINAHRKAYGPHNRKVTIGVHRRDWKKEEYYPAYVEFGHGGPAPAFPHPYIRPAFDRHIDESYEIIRSGLLGLLDELDK